MTHHERVSKFGINLVKSTEVCRVQSHPFRTSLQTIDLVEDQMYLEEHRGLLQSVLVFSQL